MKYEFTVQVTGNNEIKMPVVFEEFRQALLFINSIESAAKSLGYEVKKYKTCNGLLPQIDLVVKDGINIKACYCLKQIDFSKIDFNN